MNAAFPTTPADVPDMTYREMGEAHLRHVGRLVDSQHGIGDPLLATELAGHAVAALATQHALAERVLHTRWCTARDALVYGATLDDTAAAMGLDVDELTFGLTRWADAQHREHLMTRAQHDEVLTLVDVPEVTQ